MTNRQSDWDMDKINSFPEWRLTDYLATPEEAATFLTEVLNDRECDPADNMALFAKTLGQLARVRGMGAVAADSGLAREALYKALRPGSSPRLETMVRVLDALGLRLTVVPLPKEEDSHG